MTSRDRPTPCPLPVSTTQTARALLRIYARLKGELAKARRGNETMVPPDEAQALMGHIEAVVTFLGVAFEPSALRAIRTSPHIGPLEYGDLRANVLVQLRRRRDWMTYREIAEGIVAEHEVTLSPSQYKHFLQKLREATHALAHAGAVEPETVHPPLDGSTTQRWRLSDTLFRSR
jgi:hypothetical protein